MLLPAAIGPNLLEQYLTTFLVNDSVAIDAGSLGFFESPARQARVRHVFITHCHQDHIASLPIFLENAYRPEGPPVTIYGSEAVLDSLKKDVFNDRVWPDLVELSPPGAAFLKLQMVVPGKVVKVEGLQLTPIPVDHGVPTLGFLIEDANTSVLIPSDTGPTQEVWKRASDCTNLKAVFLEASFPNSLGWLAELTGHLTPTGFQKEIAKLTRPAKVLAVHIKPRFREEVSRELLALGLPELEIARLGCEYTFE